MTIWKLIKRVKALHNTGEPLVVAMAGIKLGDRLLMLGCANPSDIGPLAVKTGLTGRACALDEDESLARRAAAAAEKDGALIETLAAPWTMLPLDSGTFDVVIIQGVLAALAPDRRAGCLQEAHRVLRPGGRCLAIDGAIRGGLGGLIGSGGSAEYIAAGGALRALQAQGFRAVRTVAEREGRIFIEGVRENIGKGEG